MTSNHTWLAVYLIARREFLSRVRTRIFVIGTGIVVLLLAVYVVLQVTVINRLAGGATTQVAFAGAAQQLAGPVKAVGSAVGVKINAQLVSDTAATEANVRKGSVDALVSGAPAAPQVTVRDQLNPQLTAVLDSVVKQYALNQQLRAAGADPAAVQAAVAAAQIHVRSLTGARPIQQPVVGFVTAWLLYVAIAIYGNFIATGVVEDKASRIVEILLSTVRPAQLLLGKVLGIGTAGLLQVVIVGVAGVLLTVPTGVLSVPGLAVGAVSWGIAWFIIGFVLYGMLYAAAGSLVSRQEDLGTATLPITLLLIASIFVIYVVVLPQFSGKPPPEALATLLSVLPPMAPILMPIQLDTGMAPAWEALLAVLIAVATIGLVTWIAGRIYSRTVLHLGARVSWAEALRSGRS